MSTETCFRQGHEHIEGPNKWFECQDCGYQGEMHNSVTTVDMNIPIETSRECPECSLSNTHAIKSPQGCLLVDDGEILDRS